MTSMACWNCHGSDVTGMRDATGEDVAPYELFQATMMANAARDPLWRAEISVEIAATPSLASTIENKCLGCHAPEGIEDAAEHGELLTLADLEGNSPRTQLALDGVGCSFCHQIEETQDVASTFNGKYTVNTARLIYGPHDAPDYIPMSVRFGYLPTESQHVMSSNLCASCHTLYTDAVDASGTPTGGTIPEQTIFLEWQNSVFNDQVASPSTQAASCQDCHTPKNDRNGVPIKTEIARASLNTQKRDVYGKHTFVGGNTLIPQIIDAQRADLNPLGTPASFDAVIEETRRQLREDTADVEIGTIGRQGSDLLVPVTVRNNTGHKFPTGHPVRRAWVRVIVRDAQGAVVFASGDFDSAGRLVDGGSVLPSERANGPSQDHHALISQPSQVQIYQSLMADGAGDLTFLLLRGEGYLKDNRLLPEGWDPTHPAAADTLPQGTASDGDFAAGGDQVLYRVNAPLSAGPYQVEASVFYQSLSARFAAELFEYRTPEVDAFKTYYEAADRTPDMVDQANATAP
jgi:hypothetical protein